MSKGTRSRHCVWALTSTVGQIIQPSVPLRPSTQYLVRLVYQCVSDTAYTLAGDIDGNIVTDWSEPVVTYSAE